MRTSWSSWITATASSSCSGAGTDPTVVIGLCPGVTPTSPSPRAETWPTWCPVPPATRSMSSISPPERSNPEGRWPTCRFLAIARIARLGGSSAAAVASRRWATPCSSCSTGTSPRSSRSTWRERLVRAFHSVRCTRYCAAGGRRTNRYSERPGPPTAPTRSR